MDETVKVVKTCSLAVWSLVLGILSLACCGFFAGIPAVICGHMAQTKISNSGGELEGKGIATGGLVTGYIGIFLTSLMILLAAAMFLPAVSAAREKGRRAGCSSNMHQIGLAVEMYALDNQQKYPPDLQSLVPKYIKNPKVFVCPSSKHAPGAMTDVAAWTDYVFVPVKADNDAGDTILLYEKPESHNAGGNIMYTDGTVKWANKETYDSLIGDGARKPSR